MITGTTTMLREFRARDEGVLLALRNDVDLQQRLLARPRPNSADRVREWVQRVSADPASLFFVIAASSSGDAVGFLQITELDPISGHGRLGIAISADRQRQGHAREAMELVGPYLRDVFGLRKIVLDVRADNEAAITLYLALGYREVGVYREHHRVGDRFFDVVLMERALS